MTVMAFVALLLKGVHKVSSANVVHSSNQEIALTSRGLSSKSHYKDCYCK
jgi:hypothetical protein